MTGILENILFAFWFFLPAGLANMFPIFASHTPVLRNWDYPMDFNLTFRGKRLLGPHKTIRGLVVGVLVGAISALFLGQSLILGLLLGAGAISGDAVKSFFKRRLDIRSGESWLLFDQLDYILGGILFTFWYERLSLEQYFYITAVYFLLHIFSTIIGHLVGFKKSAI